MWETIRQKLADEKRKLIDDAKQYYREEQERAFYTQIEAAPPLNPHHDRLSGLALDLRLIALLILIWLSIWPPKK
jgi:hypothetical protein